MKNDKKSTEKWKGMIELWIVESRMKEGGRGRYPPNQII
jgi:hypothetical protein